MNNDYEDIPNKIPDVDVKVPWRKNKRRSKKSGLEYNTERRRELKALGVHKPGYASTPEHLKTMKQLKDMLKNTWSQVFDRLDDYKRMTSKQLEFYRRYAIYGRKNALKAVKAAGYTYADERNIHRQAKALLKHPHAEELIAAFEFEEKAKMGLLVEDVANWWERIANKAMELGDLTNANRAMESYAKYLQMFVEKREITHRVIHSKAELDARIAELQNIIEVERDNIRSNIAIN